MSLVDVLDCLHMYKKGTTLGYVIKVAIQAVGSSILYCCYPAAFCYCRCRVEEVTNNLRDYFQKM